jgi:hypothetical protein
MMAQLEFVGVDALHRRGFNGSGVVIAVLDSGFNHSHSVFQRTVVLDQHDFVDNDNDTESAVGAKANYHGTAALSILGATQTGVAVGAAFGASYMLARTENIYVEERVEEDLFVAGCEWAERGGAMIISASLGYKQWYKFADFDGNTPLVSRAAAHAVELGLFVAVANGNEGRAGIGAPADAKLVVSVGAVNRHGHHSAFSSVGPSADGRLKPDVVTIGDDVVVANDVGDLRVGSGSSYATPLVAGLAALLMQIHPTWSAQMVQEAILHTASRFTTPDVQFGRGIVNASLAVAYEPRVACLPPPDTSSSSSSDDDNAVPAWTPFRCYNDGHCDGPTAGAFCACTPGFYGRDCSLQSAGPSEPGNWTYLVNTTLVNNHDGILMPDGGETMMRPKPTKTQAGKTASSDKLPSSRNGSAHINIALIAGVSLLLMLVGLRLFRCVVERNAPKSSLSDAPRLPGGSGDTIVKMA